MNTEKAKIGEWKGPILFPWMVGIFLLNSSKLAKNLMPTNT